MICLLFSWLYFLTEEVPLVSLQLGFRTTQYRLTVNMFLGPFSASHYSSVAISDLC